ncbi:hypothetical protein MN205_05900 [Kineococcus sp. TRM81007]|uniref:hypothetical protein n=1 Tax=Kineococcus sp. TRM81007 TaxID=2925831 RepID=UPI001F5ACBD8|nr:hypothetical protein [Kineococcus sp. TRM81007]MCI2238024.1 hypothetical protein [Kineococcus sp. TRM81007]
MLHKALATLLVLGGAICLSLLLFAHPQARTGIVLAALSGAAIVSGNWLRRSTQHHQR